MGKEEYSGYTIVELHADDDALRLVLADFASWKQRARKAEAETDRLRAALVETYPVLRTLAGRGRTHRQKDYDDINRARTVIADALAELES